MIRSMRCSWRGAAILLAGVVMAGSALGEEKALRVVRDFSKGKIEVPTKILLADETGRVQRAAQAGTAAKETASRGGPTANPRVAPGVVKWHADFATACQASKKSGKPVLLFHMMGKLDDQFC
jgi:hypothetical protein